MSTPVIDQPTRTTAAQAESWLRPSYSTDVSAIIVSYNTRTMLDRTLASLLTSRQRCSLEVIVVDNGSTDGSVELVRERYPTVRCIANTDNRGHSGGSNQGMRLATGRYLFLLNSDTIINDDAVDELATYLSAHPGVGAVGGTVLNIDGTLQGTVKSLPTPMAALCGRHSLLTRLWPTNPFSRRYLVYLGHDRRQPFPVGSASGCALMVRREAVERAGPLDERLFYWNDVDWCRAIWAAGLAVHCVPSSVIVHDEHGGGSRSSRRQSRRSIIDFHRGAFHYYRKWSAPQPWHPAAGIAAVGLTGRALLVLAIEQLRWALRREGAV